MAVDNAISETWFQSYARATVCGTLKRLKNGRLTITSQYSGDKGDSVVFGEEPTKNADLEWDIVIVCKTPNVWVRFLRTFDLGFAEAYMLQEVECEDLLGLFALYVANMGNLGLSGSSLLHSLAPYLTALLPGPTNDLTHARMNASFHYDTSNELFSAFLSPDMNYSSAIWSGELNEPLEAAQRRKVHTLIDKARISPSHHLLDIGCGWGDLAMEAVKRTGCRVTGLTLSKEQKSLAEKRIKAAGLEDRIEILLCDYRQAPKPEGGYDRIISVEMLEHVGSALMVKYFESISNLLTKEGGVMVVQGITIINSMGKILSNRGGFLDRYIFPGGYLPSVNQLVTSIHTGSRGKLEVENVQSIGTHYINTLSSWRDNFLSNWSTIRKDYITAHQDATEAEIEAFKRRWVYYFTYCEAGFRTRVLDDHIITALRTPQEAITYRQ